jgi:hypothetical protein
MKNVRFPFYAALFIAIIIFALSGCKGKARPSPAAEGNTITPTECVPTCTDRECGQENDGCSGNCDPGSGCYVPTGYCVPAADTKLCPPVEPPVCPVCPEQTHCGPKPGHHDHGHHYGWDKHDGE